MFIDGKVSYIFPIYKNFTSRDFPFCLIETIEAGGTGSHPGILRGEGVTGIVIRDGAEPLVDRPRDIGEVGGDEVDTGNVEVKHRGFVVDSPHIGCQAQGPGLSDPAGVVVELCLVVVEVYAVRGKGRGGHAPAQIGHGGLGREFPDQFACVEAERDILHAWLKAVRGDQRHGALRASSHT